MVTIEDKKINPSKKIIDDIKVQIVYMPLESKLGYKYKSSVKAGEYVMIGSVLGRNIASSMPLLSSVSGTVVGFADKYISNGKLVKCVVIENDFKERYANKLGKKKDITKYSKDEFIYMLRENGIAGMSGTDYPTFMKYDTKEKIKYLIINGCECEIYASSDGALMYNHAEEILEGIDAIMEIMEIEKAYIAINEKNNTVIKQFLKFINTYPNIKIYPIINGYPNGDQKYLVNEITSLTYKNNPQEVGVIINNVSTMYAIYEMLKYHKPLASRIVSLTGPGFKKNANYELKIGTNLSELILKGVEYSNIKNPILIAGGSMMGISIPSDELIVTKDLDNILIIPNNIEKASKCIKCGKCSEVCPLGLIPTLLVENKKNCKKMLDICNLCGLCSYICPSKIELRDKIKDIKDGKNERV